MKPSSSLKTFLLSCLILLSHSVLAVDDSELLPPDEAFHFSAKLENSTTLQSNWTIAEGYYLYKHKVKIKPLHNSVSLGEIQFPSAIVKEDEYFGRTEIFRDSLTVSTSFTVETPAPATIDFEISYQGCADVGVCYPPQTKKISFPAPPSEKQSSEGGLFNDLSDLTRSLGRDNFFEDDLLPPDQAFQFSAKVNDSETLSLHWAIAKGYYLYRDKLAFRLEEPKEATIAPFSSPPGELITDDFFGEIETYRDSLEIELPLIRTNPSPVTVTLIAEFQGCADKGVCYPPMSKKVSLKLPAVAELRPAQTDTLQTTVGSRQLSEQEEIAGALSEDTLWLTVITFFGFGLLLSLTPCVFPMIPILSGIIIGHGKKITTREAFFISSVYVLATALTYTIFGILAGLFGSNLQAIFQTPWVLILFSALFVVLSLSMFGFYELQIPSRFQSKLSELSHKQKHSFIGTAIMGVLSALIVGPCVAAPLAGALIYIGQSGDALLGGLALFSMGLGSGVPLIIIGTSAGKLMPKAGPWMYAIKAFFGVSLLGVAIWLLERILPVEITMLLWAALFIGSSTYMGATDALPEQSSGWLKLWKGMGQFLLTIGVVLIIGAASGNKDVFHPLRGLQGSTITASVATPFKTIHSTAELKRELDTAASQNKWLMLDFYADWCISCKEIEATFRDPKVQAEISSMHLVKADVTSNSAEEKALLKQFNLIGPPAILFFGPDKQERTGFRVIGYKKADDFLAHISNLK